MSSQKNIEQNTCFADFGNSQPWGRPPGRSRVPPHTIQTAEPSLAFLRRFAFQHPPDFDEHTCRYQHARHHGDQVQARDEARLAVAMETRVQPPAAQVVQVRGPDLAQGAQVEQHVEDLVALADNVAAAGEPALGQRAHEEEGAGQEEHHLAQVEPQRRLVVAAAAAAAALRRPPPPPQQQQPLEHGTGVPGVGQRRGGHLAHPPHPGRPAVAAELAAAAAQAGEAGEERGDGHEDAGRRRAAAGVPALLLGGVVVVHRRAAVLVLRHAHVVHEVEEVVAQLRLAAQQVGGGAAAAVAHGRHGQHQQGPGVGVPGEVHRLGQAAQGEQEDQEAQQVGPGVDRLVVALEERLQVVAPGLVQGPVPGVDVGLAEVAGHLGVPEGGRHGGGRLGEQQGHPPELLQVDEQTADSVHGDCCHGGGAGGGGGGGYRVLGFWVWTGVEVR